MNTVQDTFQNFWYYAIFIMLLYALIIFIIEIKDRSFFIFKSSFKEHQYNKSEDWTRFNSLFINTYKFYQVFGPNNIVKKIQLLFFELLEINEIHIKDSNDKFTDDFENIEDEELKAFLLDPVNWYEKLAKPNFKNNFFLSLFRKKKILYKNIFSSLLRLERKFYVEFESRLSEGNFDINLE